jgi:hypothetical protein
MFLSGNLRKGGVRIGAQGLLTHTWTALSTLVLAHLAHRLLTEHGCETHVATWANLVLAWAADWTLGRVALIHLGDVTCALHWEHAHALDAGGVLAAGRAAVLAHLADQLGADGAGDHDIRVSVLDVHGGSLGVLVVLGLGCVLDTLGSLDDKLALSSLHNDAALDVHEGGGLGGGLHFIIK